MICQKYELPWYIVERSNLGEVTLVLRTEAIYVRNIPHHKNAVSYEWNVLIVNRFTGGITFEKEYRTYAEAEQWLKPRGYM